MADIFRAPVMTRIARPLHSDVAINSEGSVWSNRLLNLLRSRDTFFGLAGNPPWDWPVPKGPVPGIVLKTWTESLKTNLIGQDRFFGAAGQPPSYQWPLPHGPGGSIALRTWLENLLQNTLGITVQNPFALLDWPNPLGRRPPEDLQTFLDLLQTTLAGGGATWPGWMSSRGGWS